MKASRTWMLALFVLGLAAYLFWVERHRMTAEERRMQRNRVFQVDTDRVERLRLRTEAYDVGLYTTNGVWNVDFPRGARAQEAMVRRMLSRLRGFERGGLITVEDMRRQGQTLEDFGLEVPNLVLELETPSSRREFRVGNPNPLGNKIYVKEEASQNVMLASVDLLDILPDSRDAFYDPSLFPLSADGVEALSLVQEGRTIRLEREDGGWRITEPRVLEADDEQVEGLLTKLMQARAEGFVHSPEEEEEALGEKRNILRVWPRGGRVAYEVALGNDAPGMPDSCFARLEGREGLLLVSRGLKVLARTPLDSLRNPNLLPSDPDWSARAIEISSPEGEIRLERGESGWRMRQPVDRAASEERIGTLLEAWKEGRVVAFGVDVADAEEACTLRFIGEDSGEEQVFRLLRGEALPGRSLARLEDDSAVRVMPDLLRLTSPEPEAYLSPSILNFDRERVVRLNVVREGTRREFSRDAPEESWTLRDPGAEPVAEAVNRLVGVASSLRASEVVALDPASLEPYGLSDPEIRVSIGLAGDSPANRTLLVGGLDERGTSHVQVMGDGVVYRLSASDTHTFRATLHRMLEEREDAAEEDSDRENP